MQDCNLIEIIVKNYTAPLELKTHSHASDKITYYISGSGTTRIGDTDYRFKKNTFVFHKADNPHSTTHGPSNVIWLHFTHNIKGVSFKEGVFEDNNLSLLPILKKLKRASYNQSELGMQLTESLLAEALITAAMVQAESIHSKIKIDWSHIKNYIDNNIRDTIDFKALATEHGYSYDRFRHMFKEHTDMSLYSYLTERRINLAKILLKKQNLSITDVAFECGFNSSSQFANIFKSYTHLTPREFKNQFSSDETNENQSIKLI